MIVKKILGLHETALVGFVGFSVVISSQSSFLLFFFAPPLCPPSTAPWLDVVQDRSGGKDDICRDRGSGDSTRSARSFFFFLVVYSSSSIVVPIVLLWL